MVEEGSDTVMEVTRLSGVRPVGWCRGTMVTGKGIKTSREIVTENLSEMVTLWGC